MFFNKGVGYKGALTPSIAIGWASIQPTATAPDSPICMQARACMYFQWGRESHCQTPLAAPYRYGKQKNWHARSPIHIRQSAGPTEIAGLADYCLMYMGASITSGLVCRQGQSGCPCISTNIYVMCTGSFSFPHIRCLIYSSAELAPDAERKDFRSNLAATRDQYKINNAL